MWVGSEGLNIGVPTHPERMHELLGHWFVPVIAIAAFAFAVGTTRALRWLILTECGVPCAGQRIQVSANLVRRCG
jgi:hypothetical protein